MRNIYLFNAISITMFTERWDMIYIMICIFIQKLHNMNSLFSLFNNQDMFLISSQ